MDPSSSAGRGRWMGLRQGCPSGQASSGGPAGLHPALGPTRGSDPPAPASCISAPGVVFGEDQRETSLAPQVALVELAPWRLGRLPRPGFRHQCSKVQNRMKRRGSQGWRANCVFNDFLTKTNEIEIKILPVVGFPIFPKTITPVRLCSCSVSLSLSQVRGSLFSRLSANHWNQIQVLIIIHLTSLSPLISEPVLPLRPFAFPRPPSPQ